MTMYPGKIQWKKLLYLSCVFALLFANLIFAQEPSLTASIDRSTVSMGEQFEITYSLNAIGKNFKAPNFEDFIVLSGPNQSQSIQIINGNLSQTLSYSFILQPRSEGRFTISPASIEVEGKKIQSNSLTIVVTKGVSKPKQQQQSSEDSNLERQIAQNLFIKATTDKSEVYQGEQITITFKLYTRLNIVNSSINKVPAFTGFWAQDIELDRNQNFSIETLDGVQYRTIPLKKTALFPQSSGILEIDKMEANFVVQLQLRRSRDLFDQFFNDPFFGNVVNKEFKVASNILKIKVKPLPENPPSSFNGAVGKFEFDAWLDKTETKSNEPVTLKIKITGKGNLKLINPIKVNIPGDFESFEPKLSDNINLKSNIISGSRTFEYLLIPRRPGDYTIPSVSFTYFDVERKNYITLSTKEINLKVTKGSDIIRTPVSGVSKEEIQLIGQDIRFIKSGSSNFTRIGENFFGSINFILMLTAPFILFFLFLYAYNRYETNIQDVIGYRSKQATKLAKKHLNKARIFIEKSKNSEFYEEVSKAIWNYLSYKLGIQLAELNKENVATTLQNRKVKDDTINNLLNILEQCELYRYSPLNDSANMKNIYDNSVDLIKRIEEEL